VSRPISKAYTVDESTGGDDTITTGAGDDFVFGGFGNDTVNLSTGPAFVIADNGVATFGSTGVIASLVTSSPTVGVADTIVGSTGANVILGGFGGDNITGGSGKDFILGDNGSATFNATGILIDLTTTQPETGGADTINGGNGLNIVLGGNGADQITGGTGRDFVIGDNGKAKLDAAGVLTSLETTDAATVGTHNDTINVSSGDNVILGGNGTDSITSTTGNDLIAGDNAKATFDSTGGQSIIRELISTDDGIGANDTINAGAGNNTIFGGFGQDGITSLGGDDNAAGDNARAVFNASGTLTSFTTTSPTVGGNDTINVGDGTNILLGGLGNDTLTSGSGKDFILGDNGNILRTATGVLTDITTTQPDLGGIDTINGGDGPNIVLGGNGGDQITGGTGRDFVIGDNGKAKLDTTGVLTSLETTDAGIAGSHNDTINVSSSDNVILGGNGADSITSTTGNDLIAGDNAKATFDSTGGQSIIRELISTDDGIGANDTINAGAGNNTILGGFGRDGITSLGGDDNVAGDNAQAVFNAAGILTFFTTTSPTIGDNDTINAGDGRNIILGGFGADSLTSGAGSDFIAGDHGNATLTAAGVLTDLTTTQPENGGADTINGGDGQNIVLGGNGADQITGGTGRDFVLGDNGKAKLDTTGVLTSLETTDAATAGTHNDTINVSSGDNVILGGNGADSITSTTGNDLIAGDNAKATFDSTGGQSIARELISTDDGIGANDTINAGAGNNTILGGFGQDGITSLGGNDQVAGDNAQAVFNAAGILTFFTTTSPTIGDDDTIDAGDGNNLILGGFGKDTLTTGSGADLVLGDQGNATFTGAGGLTDLTTSDHTIGDDDTIRTGAGDDMAFAGTGNDFIDGEAGNDTLLGDQASYNLVNLPDPTHPRGITLLEEITGGADTIFGGSDNDLIYGEGADDLIDAGTGVDIVFAGYGNDRVFGGDQADTLVSGPGIDFLDGQAGPDSLYVDEFDTWTGGLPEDTVIGGPFFSTNTQLAFGLPILGAAAYLSPLAGVSTASAPVVTVSILFLMDHEAPFTLGALSVIFTAGLGEPATLIKYFEIRWTAGSQAFLTIFGDLGALQLIGIGEFLEILWGDIMAIIGG
jgi:Ca2+-binding RTX toxin-like protein